MAAPAFGDHRREERLCSLPWPELACSGFPGHAVTEPMESGELELDTTERIRRLQVVVIENPQRFSLDAG